MWVRAYGIEASPPILGAVMIAEAPPKILKYISPFGVPFRSTDFVAVFSIYIDESGTDTDEILVISAYLSTADRWDAFNHDWQKKILDKYKIPFFHCVEFAHRESSKYKKRYGHLTEDEWERIPVVVADCIKEHLLLGVTVLIPVKHYKEIVGRKGSTNKDGAYTLGLRGIVDHIFTFLHGQCGKPHRLHIFIESGHAEMNKAMNLLEADLPRDDGPFIFQGKVYRVTNVSLGVVGRARKLDPTAVGLQAADALAYCTRRLMAATLLGKRVNTEFAERFHLMLRGRILHGMVELDDKLIYEGGQPIMPLSDADEGVSPGLDNFLIVTDRVLSINKEELDARRDEYLFIAKMKKKRTGPKKKRKRRRKND